MSKAGNFTRFSENMQKIMQAMSSAHWTMWWLSIYGTLEYRVYLAAPKGLLAGACWGGE
jgi:hypothetical protein